MTCEILSRCCRPERTTRDASIGQPDIYLARVITVDKKRSCRVHNRRCKVKGKLYMLCVMIRRPLIVQNQTRIVTFSSLDPSIKDGLLRVTLPNNTVVNTRFLTQSDGEGHNPSSHGKAMAPLPRGPITEGGHDVNPSAGCAAKALAAAL